jgi:hypothetical protein
MDIIAKLKDAYAFLGDPLHREAWEALEELDEKLRAAYEREAGWIKNISIAKDAADKWEEKYWEPDEGRAEYDRAQEHEEETF